MRARNQILYSIGASLLAVGAVRHGVPFEYWLGGIFVVGAFYLTLSQPIQ